MFLGEKIPSDEYWLTLVLPYFLLLSVFWIGLYLLVRKKARFRGTYMLNTLVMVLYNLLIASWCIQTRDLFSVLVGIVLGSITVLHGLIVLIFIWMKNKKEKNKQDFNRISLF